MSKEGDRATAIISVCVLEDLLRKLLCAWFIKEPQVKYLFNDDHILQSFFSKVNIAYFSGLIPKRFYHDLRIMGEIRNKFAHSLLRDFNFHNKVIEQKIGQFELRPKTIDDTKLNKMKYLIVFTQLADGLVLIERIISEFKPKGFIDLIDFHDLFKDAAIGREKIFEILSKCEE